MATPDSNLPIDTNVTLPASVRNAAAAADAAHAAAYATPQPDPAATPVTPQPDPAPEPAPQPTPQTAPQPTPQPTPAPVSEEQWQHRYYSMEGRFRQSQVTIGQLQEQLRELGDEMVRLQDSMQGRPARTEPVRQGQPGPALVTAEDVKTYGPELLDLVARTARQAVEPEINEVRSQTRQVSQRVAQTTTQGLYAHLDGEVPNWRQINVDPRFKEWCRSSDVYSGQVRGALLNAAFRAADAPRVVAFFKGFQQEEVATGNAPDPARSQRQEPTAPRVPAVALETLTAPGRAKPAPGANASDTADKPVFTRAQIANFYANVRRGAYAGRDADKQRDEAAIFAAQADGRVRG